MKATVPVKDWLGMVSIIDEPYIEMALAIAVLLLIGSGERFGDRHP